jgi:hypothetical protein
MYESYLNKAMLDVLKNRMSGIADCITVLIDRGFIPNKNKMTILNWTPILIDAYENIALFTEEQESKLNKIYNKVIKL